MEPVIEEFFATVSNLEALVVAIEWLAEAEEAVVAATVQTQAKVAEAAEAAILIEQVKSAAAAAIARAQDSVTARIAAVEATAKHANRQVARARMNGLHRAGRMRARVQRLQKRGVLAPTEGQALLERARGIEEHAFKRAKDITVLAAAERRLALSKLATTGESK